MAGVDEAVGAATVLEPLEPLGEMDERHIRTLRRFALAPLMPEAQRALFVRIDQPGRAIAGALGLNGQVSGERGLAAAAFL